MRYHAILRDAPRVAPCRAQLADAAGDLPPLSDGPLPLPPDWADTVNAPLTAAEDDAVRLSIARGRPLGEPAWQRRIAARLGLASTFRDRGRPRKPPEGAIGS